MDFYNGNTLSFAVLAILMFGDVLVSLKPMKFVAECISGVGFPMNFSWALIVVKLLAVAGLVLGFWVPEVGIAAVGSLFVYFCCAITAHLRAKFIQHPSFASALTMFVLVVVCGVLLVV